jgi:Flp pilus assembly protein TadG
MICLDLHAPMAAARRTDASVESGCQRLFRCVRKESGQGLVETALSLVAAFTLAFLLFEGTLLIYTYAVLNNAAREGVRYAVVHGNDTSICSGPSAGCDSTAAAVVSVVQSYAKLSFHDMSGMKVTVSYPDATQSAPMSLVTVTVKYSYVPITQFFALSSNLSITSEGRIVY